MEKKYKAIPRFNDHGAGCKGHANFMLDSTLENEGDRQSVIKSVENYIPHYEKMAKLNVNKSNTEETQRRDGDGQIL